MSTQLIVNTTPQQLPAQVLERLTGERPMVNVEANLTTDDVVSVAVVMHEERCQREIEAWQLVVTQKAENLAKATQAFETKRLEKARRAVVKELTSARRFYRAIGFEMQSKLDVSSDASGLTVIELTVYSGSKKRHYSDDYDLENDFEIHREKTLEELGLMAEKWDRDVAQGELDKVHESLRLWRNSLAKLDQFTRRAKATLTAQTMAEQGGYEKLVAKLEGLSAQATAELPSLVALPAPKKAMPARKPR